LAGFYESFDSGVGIFNNTWGKVDTSIPGQITLRGNSGAMQKGDGNGYGRYEITAKMSADVQGPAALLWPANDEWPGAEYDIVEVIDGRPYGTVHWNNNGKDAYKSSYWNHIDETKVHTYAIEWHGNRIDYFVDDRHVGTIKHAGPDAAHGGINELMGFMNRDFESQDAFLTVYSASYDPWG
jgi:beta-glucanase (GH16 family)